jgi:hypothetical protein
VLGIFSAKFAIEDKGLLRIVIAQVNEDPIAFHVIQKESKLGVVLFVGTLFLHRESALIVHRKTRHRIPDNDGLIIDDLRAPTRTQEEIVRAIRFIAGKANGHLRVLDIRVLRVVAFKEFKLERRGTAALGIQGQFLESTHVHRHMKAEIDVNFIERIDFVVFNRVASLDGAHVVLIVDRLERDEIGTRMLATDGQRRFLESRGRECFHEALGADAEDVLVDFFIGHDSAVNRFADLDVALETALVGQRKLGIVRFHPKARKARSLDECKADLLDGMRDGLHELAQEDAIRKRHLEEEIGTRHDRNLGSWLGRDTAGINLLVGDNDALGTLGRRRLGVGLVLTRGNERVLLVIGSIGAFRRALARSIGFVINVCLLLERHFFKKCSIESKSIRVWLKVMLHSKLELTRHFCAMCVEFHEMLYGIQIKGS